MTDKRADTSGEAVAHPLSCLPDCMMPDGAEPCAGYRTLDRAYDAERRKAGTLSRQLAEAQAVIERIREQSAALQTSEKP